MIMSLVFVGVVAVCASAPAAPPPPSSSPINPSIVTLQYEEYVHPDINSYRFRFRTSDGTERQESGQLENVGGVEEALVVRGFYTWRVGDQVYRVNYVADTDGYRPTLSIQKAKSPGFIPPTRRLPPSVLASLVG